MAEHDIRCEWLPDLGAWSECLDCGLTAWQHSNSDPLADMRNAARAMRELLPGETYQPPHPAQRSSPNHG